MAHNLVWGKSTLGHQEQKICLFNSAWQWVLRKVLKHLALPFLLGLWYLFNIFLACWAISPELYLALVSWLRHGRCVYKKDNNVNTKISCEGVFLIPI